MVKERLHIPRNIRDSILEEFNHRCAICGADKPHIHHIDENPSNNDPLNLIPLCPNCHLVDQHNPTKIIEPEKLRLFREYKDPTILKSQFHPLFSRMIFLRSINDNSDADSLEKRSNELTLFISALEMGAFYSKQVGELLKRLAYLDVVRFDGSVDSGYRLRQEQRAREYREQLINVRNQIYTLIIELLRFQKWQ